MITYDGKNAQTNEVGKTFKGYKISTTKWADNGKAEKEANKDPEIKKRITLTGKKFLGKRWK